MADNSQTDPLDSKRSLSASPAEPPGGGRQDHDAMRAGAMRPVTAAASTDRLAANGGLNLPGGDPEAATITVPTVAPVPEPIPGEYDRTTVTHREPGAMATSFGEATPSPDPHDWLDDATAHDRIIEGGGDGQPHHSTEGYRKR